MFLDRLVFFLIEIGILNFVQRLVLNGVIVFMIRKGWLFMKMDDQFILVRYSNIY